MQHCAGGKRGRPTFTDLDLLKARPFLGSVLSPHQHLAHCSDPPLISKSRPLLPETQVELQRSVAYKSGQQATLG